MSSKPLSTLQKVDRGFLRCLKKRYTISRMSKRNENSMWTELSNNTKVRVLVGFENKSLPSIGWIRSCYFCDKATSRVNKLFYNKKEYYTFRCKDCDNYTLGWPWVRRLEIEPGCLYWIILLYTTMNLGPSGINSLFYSTGQEVNHVHLTTSASHRPK